ncbi:uncharacterized protein LOC133791921 [Humulus lupulus]|uniref:uncharacterized protein LOC133791921 n=1 Tax=Humulus lupulus TaxID=3486 RepID=UPI002B401151|nr:uncharacterized protein LOC133791921 [Humulus lupulus]
MPQQPMNQASSSQQPMPQVQQEKPNELQAAMLTQAITSRSGKKVEQSVPKSSVEKNEELGEKSGSEREKFSMVLEVFKKLHINIPFTEAFEQMPSYVKFMKEILSKKRKMEDYETVALTEECSAILQRKLAQKLRDLESFTIPCTIESVECKHALCDLGASINLMLVTS